MCGRFTLTDDNREHVAAMLGVPVEQLIEEEYRPQWNIVPAAGSHRRRPLGGRLAGILVTLVRMCRRDR